jgi:hypothetical protein
MLSAATPHNLFLLTWYLATISPSLICVTTTWLRLTVRLCRSQIRDVSKTCGFGRGGGGYSGLCLCLCSSLRGARNLVRETNTARRQLLPSLTCGGMPLLLLVGTIIFNRGSRHGASGAFGGAALARAVPAAALLAQPAYQQQTTGRQALGRRVLWNDIFLLSRVLDG